MNNLIVPSKVYSGLSGLQLDIPKYRFPESFQNSSRLTYYASQFNSIEINSSFYKLPQAKTLAKWAEEVPPYFRFTFKLFREITHNKQQNFNAEFVEQFFSSINAVKEKSGCVLIQFPASVGNEYLLKLNSLLKCINRVNINNWKIAIEFRNKSWYNETTFDLLNQFNSAVVIHDIKKSITPMINHSSDFMYLRFHGPTGNYRESYPEDFLSEYAGYINEWLAEGKRVYIYFNNTMGDAFNNLKTLNNILSNNIAEVK